MVSLLFCAMLFQATSEPPDILLDFYRQAFPCVEGDASPARPAAQPAHRLNDYFPAQRRIWPVLESREGQETLLNAYVESGVRPGLLLGELTTALSDRQQLERLREASRLGAYPIAPLQREDLGRQSELIMAWCGLGLCPRAFYLVDGVDASIHGLVEATYLGNSQDAEWPLPHRLVSVDGSQVLPLLEHDELANGHAAQRTPRAGLPLHGVDPLPVEWRFYGIHFRVDDDGLETSLGGKVASVLYSLSLRLWPALSQQAFSILFWLSFLFAWLSFFLVIVSLCWAFYGLFRYVNGRDESNGGRRS